MRFLKTPRAWIRGIESKSGANLFTACGSEPGEGALKFVGWHGRRIVGGVTKRKPRSSLHDANMMRGGEPENSGKRSPCPIFAPEDETLLLWHGFSL